MSELYDEAEQVTGLAYGTLRDAKYVACAVEMSRRRDKLPWSHHREVAKLPPDEQDQ